VIDASIVDREGNVLKQTTPLHFMMRYTTVATPNLYMRPMDSLLGYGFRDSRIATSR
jgi:hypothetical protein